MSKYILKWIEYIITGQIWKQNDYICNLFYASSMNNRSNVTCQLGKVSFLSDLMRYLGNSCLMVHLLILSQHMKAWMLHDKTSTGSWLIELPQIASHGAASSSSPRPGSIIAWLCLQVTVTSLTSSIWVILQLNSTVHAIDLNLENF